MFKEILLYHTIQVVGDKLNSMDEYKQLDYPPMFDNLNQLISFVLFDIEILPSCGSRFAALRKKPEQIAF